MTKGLVKAWKSFGFASEYFQDMLLYLLRSGHSPFAASEWRLYYKILIETHTIEKGLSLPTPKPLFGREKVKYVISAARSCTGGGSVFPLEMALGALQAYKNYHADLGIDDPLLDDIEDLLADNAYQGVTRTGGFKLALNNSYAWASGQEFLAARFSCRNFAEEVLARSTLEEVIGIAGKAPSQCNRQATKVHSYQDPDLIGRLLALQGGSRGFADGVRNLFVVTSELTAWGGPSQRNQLYVDGALFSMSLMMSAQSFGLATCPLNLAVTNSTERAIRKAGDIPSSERLIMMIAIGRPAPVEGLRIAASPRRPVAEILHFH